MKVCVSHERKLPFVITPENKSLVETFLYPAKETTMQYNDSLKQYLLFDKSKYHTNPRIKISSLISVYLTLIVRQNTPLQPRLPCWRGPCFLSRLGMFLEVFILASQKIIIFF
mmetsp:Transcript_36029/g.61450  ORF Transcript_36029/g.61450 Transcript_36029/m.61450 type:complete len:113 (-) Transcript_36029:842-1180(-)